MRMAYGVIFYICFYFLELTEAQITRLNECRNSIEYKESHFSLLCFTDKNILKKIKN